jgi:uncharacterized protein (TIGR03435 family)
MRPILLVLTVCVAFGQDAAPPAFEVASVKVAAPLQGGAMMFGSGSMRGGPGSTDPGRITYNSVLLKAVVARAYNVKDYQVEGPAWLDSERYDIMATMPQGVTKEQLALMLQGLLAERFKLTLHHENKAIPVYVLSVGKGGPKLKEVDVSAAEAPGSPPPPPPSRVPGKAVPAGMVRIMIGMNNRRLEGSLTIARLCDSLSNWVDRAVLDQTDLKGTYEFDLSWTPDENDRLAGQMSMAMAAAGHTPPPPGEAAGASDPGLSLAQALQTNYGLKLEARRNPADVIVIARAERVPTAN